MRGVAERFAQRGERFWLAVVAVDVAQRAATRREKAASSTPSSLASRLSRIRSRKSSMLEPPRATPMTGTSSDPMADETLERGKDLLVREVAGDAEYDERVCGNGAHRRLYFGGAPVRSWWPPNSTPHRRQQAVGEVVVVARGEAREQRRREHGHRHACVDGRVHGPAAFTGVGDLALETHERRVARERGARRDRAATSERRCRGATAPRLRRGRSRRRGARRARVSGAVSASTRLRIACRRSLRAAD